jgi:hypothetical protein
VRLRRIGLRALALMLAVGLGAALVGLSAAPRLLPGDTFRLTVRASAGDHVDVGYVLRAVAVPDLSDLIPRIGSDLLALAPALLLLTASWVAANRRRTRHTGPTAAVASAAGCRGPPSAW